MKGKSRDIANSKRVVKMNEQVRLDVFLTEARKNTSTKWEKAKERFRRPAYYGVIQ